MGAARPAAAPDVCEKRGVHAGDLKVVVLDRNSVQDAAHEGSARGTAGFVGEFDTNQQLCCRHCGNRDVVFISDEALESATAPFNIDEDRRVENQAGH
jgi:hypothetical protein